MGEMLDFLWDAMKEGRDRGVNRVVTEEVAYARSCDIRRAAAALLETNVGEEKVKALLCKHWDLRPSEAEEILNIVRSSRG